MSAKTTILVVDDDIYYASSYVAALQDCGYRVLTAGTVTDAIVILKERRITLVVIDIMLPLGGGTDLNESQRLAAHGGYLSGLILATWIRDHKPRVKIVALSAVASVGVRSWFSKHGLGFIGKPVHPDKFARFIQSAITRGACAPPARTFIVHGRDEAAKLSLKNYLQNTLDLEEPIILHEQPSLGRTIIEKFEQEAGKVDMVFVLLTPDDVGSNLDWSDDQKRRARQNVIFEMGYFLGRFGRRGRVILLHNGPIELPSDISGLAYIDISGGIEAAGELIRKELAGAQIYESDESDSILP